MILREGRLLRRVGARSATVLMAMLAVAGVVPAASDAQPPGMSVPVVVPTQSEDQLLDEVIVKDTRLWRFRQEMVKTEDKFFALYNELNKNDDFDVHCATETPLGTHIQSRVCRVAFYEHAQAEAVQELLDGNVVVDPGLVLLERWSEYRKNALTIINGDQRLLKLAHQREAIEKKYNEERKRRFKGRIFAID
jgi:hypothetical protein